MKTHEITDDNGQTVGYINVYTVVLVRNANISHSLEFKAVGCIKDSWEPDVDVAMIEVGPDERRQ